MSNTSTDVANLPVEKRELLQLLLQQEGGEFNSFPLSFAQQRLWFLHQFEPDSAVYNIPSAVRLSGALQLSALEATLSEIVRRHEVLRTRFVSIGGQPVQVIDDPRPVALLVTELDGLDAPERAAEVRRLIRAEARRPFDLAQGPLLRSRLLRLGAEEHVLLLTMHHIVSDGWSLGVLVREVAALYEAFSQGRPSPLPALAIQYADYAVWQREWLSGEVLARQLAYWRAQLAQAPVLELPSDYPRPKLPSYAGAHFRFILEADLTARLQALSRREGVTLFMTLLAAFKVLLSRYTGQEEIAVGTPIAGRTQLAIEPLIGFFVNTLVLRTRVEANESFSGLLRRVREVTLGAYAHQDVPFERLVEELAPERSLSHTPLFQVLFTLQNFLLPELKVADLSLNVLSVERETAKFDLAVVVQEGEEGLEAVFEYRRDLFDGETVARMATHYERVLESVVADPTQGVSAVPVLSGGEREQLLVEWNDTTTRYPRDAGVPELFESQVRRTPRAVAVVSDEEQVTYGELDARATALAAQLRALGVGAEVVVGVLLERSVEMVVALLGVLKAGGAYLPLDLAYPPERLRFMLADADAPLLLTQARLRERVPAQAGVRVLCLDAEGQEPGAEATVAAEASAAPSGAVTGAHLAYVIYTSGSTGQPKGVCVPHRAIARLVLNTDYLQLAPPDRVAQAANTAFDAATFEVWGALLNGAALVLLPSGALSLAELGASLARHQVSTLWLTAGLFHQMVDERLADLLALRHVLAGGDVLSPAHVRRFLEAAPASCLLINGYGPTENTTFSCCQRLSVGSAFGASVPIGRPIANTQAYVLDGEMEPVPIGVSGELYLGGDGLARGYLKRPGQTAERFVPDPFSREGGRRLYRTGDLVRYTTLGELEYLGRGDQQVKLRGYRIELGEIEAALTRQAEVREAVVVAREEAGGEKRLVAYVVAEERGETPRQLSVSGLRTALKEQLPEYMVPTALVLLDELPLTPNGKVDRKALPAPEASSVELSTGYQPPRTEVEELLVQLWAGVLGVERVGINDNFFELGGHSLLATQLVARVRESFQVELPLPSNGSGSWSN